MAAPAQNTQQLRTQLESSRWQMHNGLQRIEDQLNVSRRVRTEFKEHPMKWVAISAGIGLVAAKVIPLLFGGGKRGVMGRMLTPLLRAGAAAALPLIAHKASAWAAERGIAIPGLLPVAPPPVATAPYAPVPAPVPVPKEAYP